MSQTTCPECWDEVDPEDNDAVRLGEQWWHRECMQTRAEWDEYQASKADDDA